MFGVWSSTINPGTVIAFALVIFTGYYAFKGKQAAAADEHAKSAEQSMRDFRDNYTAEHERNESLEKQLVDQREKKHAALNEVARLTMLTDMTNVLKAIADLRAETATKFTDLIAALDSFSATQQAQTAVLQEIAASLKARNQ